METPLVNRVAASGIITLNLEEYYPEKKIHLLDLKDYLFHGLILKEKDFRAFVSKHDWEEYQDTFVALHCSTDAIVPGWAYMLVATKLQPYAAKVVQGDLDSLETSIYQSILEDLDFSEFDDKSVIVKGCSNKPVPANAYLHATTLLQNVARSVMYGEACSSVPLYKRK